MTDIDKAAQEAWKQIRSDPSLNLTVEASYFRTGFRAGAEWREGQPPIEDIGKALKKAGTGMQRPDKTEALEALETLHYVRGEKFIKAVETIPLTSERVPEGYVLMPRRPTDEQRQIINEGDDFAISLYVRLIAARPRV